MLCLDFTVILLHTEVKYPAEHTSPSPTEALSATYKGSCNLASWTQLFPFPTCDSQGPGSTECSVYSEQPPGIAALQLWDLLS